jgi:uncharacterized protein YyaL (SSP411 family)
VIQWLAWGEEAFARARETRRPLLLSLTATWCGACHRMDEETWEDPGVAAVVERVAVPVRVDADERPDLYGRYHLGGLPSTVVLDAAGEFVRGGTFLSPTQLLGLLDAAQADLRAGRRPAGREPAAPAPAAPLVREVVARLLRRADREHGGFGEGAKQPEPDALTLLLREARRTGEAEPAAIAREALDAIAAHLVDARDGGFFRYAAAPDWSGPHTEKVTVDQAALITLFLEAAVTLDAPDYRRVAVRALGHARARLIDAQGRAYASVAAAPREKVDRRRFADAGAALFRAALLAEACTGEDAGLVLEAPGVAGDGAVAHWLDAPAGAATPRGLLRDQALSIAAVVDAYRLRGGSARLDWATRAASWSLAHLWDERLGAFRDAPLTLPSPPAGARVSASPSPLRGEGGGEGLFTPLIGNGEMAQALLALADHTGEAEWRRVAANAVAMLGGRAARSPAGATLALAAQRLEGDAPIADLEGDSEDPRARALARAVVAALGPQAVVRWTPRTAAPCVTVCVGPACFPAMVDVSEVSETLRYTGRQ